ncbi:MAG: acyl-CoA dehydrogenase family protein [Chloroflexi bacterium]|nr:acyl-CoA dehydrogenase family protein [Chloroflexota bacterium]
MVEFALNENQLALKELAREFADEHIRPTAKEREYIADPRERFPWDIVRAGSELGIRTLAVPEAYGGPGADHLSLCVVGEELAKADLGVAVIFDQTWKFTTMLYAMCTPDQIQRHLSTFMTDPEYLLALGATEPEAGSDTWMPYDEPGAGITTFAQKDGDSFVLNGKKHFISTTPEAKLYAIVARTDRTARYSEGALSAFLIPKGHPGLNFGIIHEKIGQRLTNNGEIYLENCRVHKDDILVGEGQFHQALLRVMRGSNTEAAATTLGVGQAAYEAALAYAKQRVQGGKPIIEHQAIGFMLAEMLMRLEAARLLIWKSAWSLDHEDPPDLKLPKIAKIFASEVAVQVAIKAIEIHGGAGIMRNLPMEKYLRDAVTFLHSDGANQIMLAAVQKMLIQGY